MSENGSTKTDLPSCGLGGVIDAELAILAEIDARFRDEIVRVESSSMPPYTKERLIQQLEARRSTNRQPHVLRLAELYENLQMGRALSAKIESVDKDLQCERSVG